MCGITPLTGVPINAASKLVRDASEAAVAYTMRTSGGIGGERTIQCEETWSFVYATAANVAGQRPRRTAPAILGPESRSTPRVN